MTGYLTDRLHLAEIHVKAPAGFRVDRQRQPRQAKGMAGGEQEWDFKWDTARIPGHHHRRQIPTRRSLARRQHSRLIPLRAQGGDGRLCSTALREFAYSPALRHSGIDPAQRGGMPDDTVPVFWAPEIAAVCRQPHRRQEMDFRLLANTIAHQWWGSEVSPCSLKRRPLDHQRHGPATEN